MQEAAVLVDDRPRDLRDDVDQRHVRALRLHQRARGDERAGAGGRQQRRRAAGGARVAVGREARRELGAVPDVGEVAAAGAHPLPDRQRVDARQAEDRLRAAGPQAVDDDVPADAGADGASHGGTVPREMMSRMMSLVPSQISSSLASRSQRSAGYSRE